MKILFIGGTGVISSACTDAALQQGDEVYLLNRGQTKRTQPGNANLLIGNAYDPVQLKILLAAHTFDVVVQWIGYVPEHIQHDIDLFTGKVGQYIFISSASAYQTPPEKWPITENTPLSNPYWEYSRNKIACERLLRQAFENKKFPMTIVRPSHTYDCTKIPIRGGWTAIDRMRRGKKVIVHGDGSSLWTLTHHRDFAVGFNGLLGKKAAIGEAFHITSDEWLSWERITRLLARAAGVDADIVTVPSRFITSFDPEMGAGLLGDKTHSMIFDNRKIKALVPDFECRIPFEEGAREMIAWYEADPERQQINTQFNIMTEKIILAYETRLV